MGVRATLAASVNYKSRMDTGRRFLHRRHNPPFSAVLIECAGAAAGLRQSSFGLHVELPRDLPQAHGIIILLGLWPGDISDPGDFRTEAPCSEAREILLHSLRDSDIVRRIMTTGGPWVR